jgi:hypothetical protein
VVTEDGPPAELDSLSVELEDDSSSLPLDPLSVELEDDSSSLALDPLADSTSDSADFEPLVLPVAVTVAAEVRFAFASRAGSCPAASCT